MDHFIARRHDQEFFLFWWQQIRAMVGEVSVSRLQDLNWRTDLLFSCWWNEKQRNSLDLSPILNNDFIQPISTILRLPFNPPHDKGLLALKMWDTMKRTSSKKRKWPNRSLLWPTVSFYWCAFVCEIAKRLPAIKGMFWTCHYIEKLTGTAVKAFVWNAGAKHATWMRLEWLCG